MAESLHLVMDQWIQCKLGKQYFLSHHDSPANGQAVIFLTRLLEVLVVYF